MTIVDMRIGDPVELDPSVKNIVLLIPMRGLGTGYASKLVGFLEDEIRPLGETDTASRLGRDFYGLVSHDGEDYNCAPRIIEEFLERLYQTLRRKSPVAVVISGRDMPVNVRFEFMATLARAKLPIKLFDFPSS